ncbi:hypothetical protein [Alkalihalobacillus sp. 1P02AB]
MTKKKAQQDGRNPFRKALEVQYGAEFRAADRAARSQPKNM